MRNWISTYKIFDKLISAHSMNKLELFLWMFANSKIIESRKNNNSPKLSVRVSEPLEKMVFCQINSMKKMEQIKKTTNYFNDSSQNSTSYVSRDNEISVEIWSRSKQKTQKYPLNVKIIITGTHWRLKKRSY